MRAVHDEAGFDRLLAGLFGIERRDLTRTGIGPRHPPLATTPAQVDAG